MRYDLPETYPRDVPTVYVSGNISYERRKPEHLLNWVHPPDDDDAEWAKWCIRDQHVGWDPNRDSLVKLTSMMRASFADPHTDNTFEEA
jgi:hypothetical protein